jgi:hypothetical protein
MLQRIKQASLVGGLTAVLIYLCLWHWRSLQVDYSTLEQLLFTRQWMAADIETSEIISKLLLEAVDNQTFFGYSRVPLNNKAFRIINGGDGGLPCKDLQVLDQLWSKYSNKQFGFSAQERIASSIPDYPDNVYEISNDFEQSVGWHWNYSDKPSSHPEWYRKAQEPEKARGFLPSNLWALDIKIEKPVYTPAVLQTLHHFRSCTSSRLSK